MRPLTRLHFHSSSYNASAPNVQATSCFCYLYIDTWQIYFFFPALITEWSLQTCPQFSLLLWSFGVRFRMEISYTTWDEHGTCSVYKLLEIMKHSETSIAFYSKKGCIKTILAETCWRRNYHRALYRETACKQHSRRWVSTSSNNNVLR